MLPEELLKKVRQIEIATRKSVDDFMSGGYKSHFKGHGVQFSEHRLYVHGDDVRHIDWKVSARTRDPLIKKYDEERELTVFLVVDVSGSQFFGSHQKLKTEILAEIGGMITYAATHTGDKVGVLFFSNEIEMIIPPKKGRQHVLRIIRNLLSFEPRSRGTSLSAALDATGRIMKHRGIIFILSDFMNSSPQSSGHSAGHPSPPDRYDLSLRRLSQRHDVVAIQIKDPREEIMPELGIFLMVNEETGEETYVDTRSYSFQKWFKNETLKRSTVETVFKTCQIEHVCISTEQDYSSALVRFFKARRRR